MNKLLPGMRHPEKLRIGRRTLGRSATALALAAALPFLTASDCKERPSHGTSHGQRHDAAPKPAHSKKPKSTEPKAHKEYSPRCNGIKFTDNGDTATFSAITEGEMPPDVKVEGEVSYDLIGLAKGAKKHSYSERGTSVTADHGDYVSVVSMKLVWKERIQRTTRCRGWYQTEKLLGLEAPATSTSTVHEASLSQQGPESTAITPVASLQETTLALGQLATLVNHTPRELVPAA